MEQKMDVQNSESIETTSQVTEQNPQQNAVKHEGEIPTIHLQNRAVGILFWKQIMEDGKSVRIIETLDMPVAFSGHPELVKEMNNIRMEVFGEEGKMYIVKNIPVPAGVITYYAKVNSKTGKRITLKVLTSDEANERIAKDRAEIQRNREKNIRRYGENGGEGFHLLQDAINSANDRKITAIAVNNN